MNRSNLSRLSPEIRNLIYTYTFTSDFAVEFGKLDIQHPLTKTCRQIRAESLFMYYSCTKFNAHLNDGPILPLIKWLHIVGKESALLIREIRLWDMHDNVLTLLSPAAAAKYLADTSTAIRRLPPNCSLPEDNALAPQHRLSLWEAIGALNLGLRQFTEQYPGSSLMLSTSSYALTDLQAL